MENETVESNKGLKARWSHGPCRVAALLLSLAPLSFSCASFAKSEAFLAGRPVGKVQDESLRELSGIATSRRNPGVLYVHNDSGDGPRVYALNEKAHLLGVLTIQGAQNRDWEDIAIGPGPDPSVSYVYIGDIGDNGSKRSEIIVYRVAEPKVDAAAPFGQMTIGPAEAIRLTYPDGPRDAETLLVDPLTRDLYIISKRDLVPRVYRAAYPQAAHAPVRSRAMPPPTKLERVAQLPLGTFPTGGSVSPDGRRVIIRGMFHAVLWERPAGEPLWHAFSDKPRAIPVASEPQGEAICFDSKGQGYFTISEGKHPYLYYFGPAEPNSPRQ